MIERICIDGNNLLHAMHAEAPVPNVGRETLVKYIERWAQSLPSHVLLVFDGPSPRTGLAKQMSSQILEVRFSENRTADDVLVDQIHAAKHPERIRVISSDKAILKEARYRRCLVDTSEVFVAELFDTSDEVEEATHTPPEKPQRSSPEETDAWLDTFGIEPEDEEPFDGFNAMKP